MKRSSTLYIIIALPFLAMMYFSCKKEYHSTNPTPKNFRLLSYTKVTSQSIIFPVTATPVISDNWRFVYRGDQKVAQIFFTTNDSNKLKHGMGNLSIKFTYIADTIYKTSTDLNTGTVKERDTFLINAAGQITNAFFPNEVRTYQYYGILLANESV